LLSDDDIDVIIDIDNVVELGRNPERMLAALYSDKPHQFHEVR